VQGFVEYLRRNHTPRRLAGHVCLEMSILGVS